jgi:hypothetical protein
LLPPSEEEEEDQRGEVGEEQLSTEVALDVRPVVQLKYLLKEMEALSSLTLMALPETQVPTNTHRHTANQRVGEQLTPPSRDIRPTSLTKL